MFPERVFELSTEIVQDGRVTAEGLAVLRLQMPYADLTALERDRRLDRIDDLLTVDLLTRYVTWKLRGNGGAQYDVLVPAPDHFPGEPTISVVSARVRS